MWSAPRRHPNLAAFAAYLLLSSVATWPLLARFGSEIGGDLGDAWQTLWGFWWWKESLFTLHQAPTFCTLLRHPHGIPMAFQTWDLPAALWILPLWALTPALPEVSIYNAALFASFPLAGFAAYLLCRETWGGWLGPFLAGCLYTVSAYHFGHALGHLHIVSMEWSPLYFLGLLRTVRRPGWRAPILAGLALAAAATASFYHLAFCFAGTLVLLPFLLRSDGRLLVSTAFIRRVAALAAVFLALTGWLYAGMLRAWFHEPYAGAHDSAWFSADLLSFFLPNPASAWAARFPAWRAWTGNAAESAGYLGWVALGLALVAAVRFRAARPWLAVAGAGVVLSLGPYLHVGGRVHRQVLLPYGWIEKALPILGFTGVPTRFSWLATFGVTVAAGASLSALARRGRWGGAAATAVAALALVECWPHAMVTSAWPAPAFLREWGRDSQRWAVLDATDAQRALWHQVLHRHPQVGGYVTRAPERLERWLSDTPVLRPFFAWPPSRPPQREEAVRALQQLGVRFVLVDHRRLRAALALGLPRVREGPDLAVFEVPAAAP